MVCYKLIVISSLYITDICTDQRIEFGRCTSFSTYSQDYCQHRRSPEIIKRLIPSSVSSARSRIIGTLNKPIRHNPNLSPDETKALKELWSDNNIIILKSDKGNATVVMDRRDYESKLSTMLNDTSTYKKLKRKKSPSPRVKRNKSKSSHINSKMLRQPANKQVYIEKKTSL